MPMNHASCAGTDASQETLPSSTHEGPPHTVVDRNVSALAALRSRHLEQRSLQNRIADAITRFAGGMPCIYLHAVLFGSWLLVNGGVLPIIEPFDPYPFVMLAMFASVEAIFLSTFVLISQNRQAELAEKRNDLDLQVNLLSEHEITRILQLVDAIARQVGVACEDHETDVLKKDVRPEALMERMEAAEQRAYPHRGDTGSAAG
jgi:uncharacterized membrane protein